jgi:hypothetical protein
MSVPELKSLLGSFSLNYVEIRGRAGKLNSWLDRGIPVIVPSNAAKHFFVYLARNGARYLRYNPPLGVRWVGADSLGEDWEHYGLAVSTTPFRRNPLQETRATKWFGATKYGLWAGGLLMTGLWVRRRQAARRQNLESPSD